jgi:hypothetical protein
MLKSRGQKTPKERFNYDIRLTGEDPSSLISTFNKLRALESLQLGL